MQTILIAIIIYKLMDIIEPNWPAPSDVNAVVTTRSGGCSKTTYASFNLADHVGDNHQHVLANRARLQSSLGLPAEPLWLTQIHSNRVISADNNPQSLTGDAIFTSKSKTICPVLTADCLPILLCNLKATEVAAIHAGWRGLAAGIIENTINAMESLDLIAWLGPAIGPETFIVGQDVYDSFQIGKDAFKQTADNRWLFNIYLMARIILTSSGIKDIYGGDFCTYTDSKCFYSYRRDNGKTGRIASLIWLS